MHTAKRRDATLDALGVGGSNARIRALAPDGGSYVFVDFSEALDGRPLKILLERAIERGVLFGARRWMRGCVRRRGGARCCASRRSPAAECSRVSGGCEKRCESCKNRWR